MTFNTLCKGEFLFKNENVYILFEGQNKPENVNIKVVNSNGESDSNYNVDNDFIKSFVEYIAYDTDYSTNNKSSKAEVTNMDNNQYYYVDNVKLSQYYSKGNNIIMITYEIGNKKFKLRNDVYVDDNYTYAKEKLFIE